MSFMHIVDRCFVDYANQTCVTVVENIIIARLVEPFVLKSGFYITIVC